MKKVVFILSVFILAVAMVKPESKQPLTFEQAMTQGYYAFLDFADTDTSDADLESKYDLAVAKIDYIESNWDVEAELDARRPTGGFVCSVIGYVSWMECPKSIRNPSSVRYCHMVANNTTRDWNRMWPWLP
jgi:hypothetical protein